MDIYANCKSHLGERNDCSVKALARAFDLPYDMAHRICKKSGRKDKSGFDLHYSVFELGRNKKSRVFKGKRIGYHSLKKGITIKRFMRLHPTGTYLICIYRHYCTLIDGELYNQYNKNQRIKYYYYISKLKKNESPDRNEAVVDSIPICEAAQDLKAVG